MASAVSFEEHLQTGHGLERLDGLLNTLHLLRAEHYMDRKLVSDTFVNDEHHLHVCNRANHAPAACPRLATSVSAKGQQAFLSYNQCVSVVENFAPIVAYLVASFPARLTVQEANIGGVQETQRLRMYFVGSGLDVDGTRFESDSDPTAPQYGREQRLLHPVEHYPTQPPQALNTGGAALGSRHAVHLRELHGEEALRYFRSEFTVLKAEAFNRTINNILFRELVPVGGPTALSDMEEE
ncbi:hypothetical protein BDW02DRAFT_633948 [Decorospora gaudefroyi]|uniref:Uncharacterized protein n=1 Tax=Decorospora gaudefroyi TaxID=184978 RepID=A0A6A5K067_9PLEO|nr:hypothetical protein BDW02DRAFT_633948 [Decorospora gaudefroyi]